MARKRVSPWGFIGLGGLACDLFLILATAVVAPWWVTALFVLLWLVLLVLGVGWFSRHPTWVPWLAAIGFLVWFPVIAVGARAGGWS